MTEIETLTPNHLRLRGMLITRSREGVSIFGSMTHQSVPDRLFPEDLPAIIKFLADGDYEDPRDKIIAEQRSEIVGLLEMLYQALVNGSTDKLKPRWIQERIAELEGS
jgi:hypothetical protein